MSSARWAALIAFDLIVTGAMLISHAVSHAPADSYFWSFGGLAIGTGLTIVANLIIRLGAQSTDA